MAVKAAVKEAEPVTQDAAFESPSGRTSVMVTMEPDGSFAIRATRDGRVIHDFSNGYEQPGVDGLPKNTTS